MKNSFLIVLSILFFLSNRASGQIVSKSETSQINTTNTISLEGIPLPNAYAPGIFGRAQLDITYVVMGCCCVQMPCYCDSKNPRLPIIFGVLTKDILSKEKSVKKTNTGHGVTLYKINKDAKIQTPVMVSINKKTISKVKINAIRKPGTSNNNTGNLFIKEVIEAFLAGWELGTEIDQATGASDEVSDWMLEFFGPWK